MLIGLDRRIIDLFIHLMLCFIPADVSLQSSFYFVLIWTKRLKCVDQIYLIQPERINKLPPTSESTNRDDSIRMNLNYHKN